MVRGHTRRIGGEPDRVGRVGQRPAPDALRAAASWFGTFGHDAGAVTRFGQNSSIAARQCKQQLSIPRPRKYLAKQVAFPFAPRAGDNARPPSRGEERRHAAAQQGRSAVHPKLQSPHFRQSLSSRLSRAPLPAMAEDILVTQYKADPSGAPYGIAIDKGFFKKAGVDITGVISGEGGGTSVRAVIASDLGYGETSPARHHRRHQRGPGHQDRRYRIALARRQRHHRDAELADQDDAGPQGQEIRHQQSEIARAK